MSPNLRTPAPVRHDDFYMELVSRVMKKEDLLVRKGLSLDRLSGFLDIVDAGGIAAAARGDTSRHSQLTRQLAELEKFYELQLVDRRGRAFALTAEGKDLEIAARTSFTMLCDVGAYEGGRKPRIVVGTGNSVFHWWVGPRPEAFAGTWYQFEMLSGPEIVAGLSDSKLHFGIIRASDVTRGLRTAPLGTIGYALYVSNKLVPKAKPVDLKQLFATVPIGGLTGEPRFSKALEAALSDAGVNIPDIHLCETFPELRVLVMAGKCAAVLPTLARHSPSHVREIRDPILGEHDGDMVLAWTTHLERQRPGLAAMIPEFVRALQLDASAK